ncbi:uncharacterized protein C8Q71DRAFT_706782 [Rhodofomes roseus]|uniref:Uncharacterized protein n=1 Tax=Rhodofomes roseus TaxID=34475 RepID=A0ABQ8KHL5_9APHY|nr:uncharacterized protein C8Q71DRAFT_706782 [Rhodofomes roseus]KAH9837225.1 hypothetical protein C8Q71DRAFT_706782 [Rhodofomes roseus]
MGNHVSRAQYLTLGSFVVNFGTQLYGMLTSPNMKEVADRNHYAFSPNPWFISAFFSGQVVLQLAWIRKLFSLNPAGYEKIGAGDTNGVTAEEVASVQTATEYAPIYALGNLCIAGWLFFWLREEFTASQFLVTINSFVQLAAVARLPPVTPGSSRLTVLTHLVAKTFAGIGVLDLLDNGGVMSRYTAPPSKLVKGLTYALFPLATAVSTPFFGLTLLYDVVGVCVGQRNVLGASGWSTGLGWTAGAMGTIVVIKTLFTQKVL